MSRFLKRLLGFIVGALALAATWGVLTFFLTTAAEPEEEAMVPYSDSIFEEYSPEEKMLPGVRVEKEIMAENPSSMSVIVRIKMEESWSRNGESFGSFSTADQAFYSVGRTGVEPEAVYSATQAGGEEGLTDGLTEGDESVVFKSMDTTSWMDGGDGYWYYSSFLPAGSGTAPIVTALIMADNADMGYISQTDYYSIADVEVVEPLKAAFEAAQAAYTAEPTDENKAIMDAAEEAFNAACAWDTTAPEDLNTVTYIKKDEAPDGSKLGYSQAQYTLNITTEICQARKSAVAAEWTENPLPDVVKTALGW